MTKTKTDKKAEQLALLEWRKKYFFDIMEANRKVLETIRDSKTATDKNKIESAKTLSRMAGGLQPDKESTKPQPKTPKIEESPITPKDKARIDGILAE